MRKTSFKENGRFADEEESPSNQDLQPDSQTVNREQVSGKRQASSLQIENLALTVDVLK